MHPFFDQLLGDGTICEERIWFVRIINFLTVVAPLTWIAFIYMELSAAPARITRWMLLYVVLQQIFAVFLCLHSSLAFALPALVLYSGSLVRDYYSKPWPRLIRSQRQAQDGDLNNVYAATTQAQLDAILNTHARALIMFHAGWEAPAQEIDPLFTWLADEYSAPGFFAFVRVDLLSAPPALKARYRLTADSPTPHFVIVEEGAIFNVFEPQSLGMDWFYTTTETQELLVAVKRLSDDAWAAAHAAALVVAEASSTRAYFHFLNGARARTQAFTDRPVAVGPARAHARKAAMRIAYEQPKFEAGVVEEVGEDAVEVGRYSPYSSDENSGWDDY